MMFHDWFIFLRWVAEEHLMRTNPLKIDALQFARNINKLTEALEKLPEQNPWPEIKNVKTDLV